MNKGISTFKGCPLFHSRLMEDDEVTTVRKFDKYMSVVSEFIEKHHGLVVDSPGDNLTAEFVI